MRCTKIRLRASTCLTQTLFYFTRAAPRAARDCKGMRCFYMAETQSPTRVAQSAKISRSCIRTLRVPRPDYQEALCASVSTMTNILPCRRSIFVSASASSVESCTSSSAESSSTTTTQAAFCQAFSPTAKFACSSSSPTTWKSSSQSTRTTLRKTRCAATWASPTTKTCCAYSIFSRTWALPRPESLLRATRTSLLPQHSVRSSRRSA